MPTLVAALPRREPRRHLYDLISDYFSRSGKGLRPALCIATCRAFGGRAEDALKSAAALELLHNAFLVHDDIEDGSEYPARPPADAPAEHGIGIAVNVGDAMIVLSIQPADGEPLGARPDAEDWRVFEEIQAHGGCSRSKDRR